MNGTIRIRNLSRLGIKEVEEKLQQVFPNWQPSHNLSCSEYRTVNSIEKPSIMPVSLKLPEYSSYTNNTAGFHLFITVENNGLELIDIVLHEFFVYHNSRQWMYTSGLSGYGQNEASIHPKCAKTFAKIWSGTDWKEEKLTNGDYAFFSFYCNKKEYAYKFFLNENGWVSEYTHCSPQKEA